MNLRRNDGDPEAEIERGTETRAGIGKGGVVRGTEIETGVTEENVPRGTGIARENGTPFKNVSVPYLKQLSTWRTLFYFPLIGHKNIPKIIFDNLLAMFPTMFLFDLANFGTMK